MLSSKGLDVTRCISRVAHHAGEQELLWFMHTERGNACRTEVIALTNNFIFLSRPHCAKLVEMI